MKTCPVWSSSSQTYVGLVNLTDFIGVVQENYRGSLEEMEELEDQKLQDWLRKTKSTR